jgi:predicted AlkP superfamily pyrophosphatase or phosphodiesterase
VEHISVWTRDAVPEHLQYGTNPRLGDVIVAPDLGWQFSRTPRGMLGAHGYDPEEPDMQVIFRACGPDFKQGFIDPDSFVNVDVYPLLAHLLHVVPAPTDGDFSRVAPLLVK